MAEHVAFLRGINLNGRKVLMADLRQAFQAMGFSGAATILASGNVVFDADPDPDLAARIEAGLATAFDMRIGVVLRRRADLQSMVDSAPFSAVAEDADVKLYVAMLARPAPTPSTLPKAVAGDYEIVAATDLDVFAVALRTPEGRYGPGLDAIDKAFGKNVLVTTRNWNTIIKAAGGAKP